MKRRKTLSLILLFVLLLSVCIGCAADVPDPTTSRLSEPATTTTTPATPVPTTAATTIRASTVSPSTTVLADAGNIPANSAGETTGELIVSFIDVGQADSILVQQGSSAMLIDAGNNADADLVVSFLEDQGITRLDYVIGTHPHEDHIGGLDAVIASFEIGKVILPDALSTTRTFEDVLLAIQARGLKITKAVPGSSYELSQATVSILGPVLSQYDDLNDASVVCRITFGNTSFLFTGDAEEASESAMIRSGTDLQADVLKVGHHGSDSSTCAAFLDLVRPQYAVISVGADNSYGHPSSVTLDALLARDISVYRTDLAGTITAVSDGSTITFGQAPEAGSTGAADPAATAVQTTVATTTAATATAAATTAATTAADPGDAYIVYITETGSKYHRDGCRYLSQSKIEITLSDALASGYTPCSVCKP